MKCPSCVYEMTSDENFGMWKCPNCGVSGPAFAIENIEGKIDLLDARDGHMEFLREERDALRPFRAIAARALIPDADESDVDNGEHDAELLESLAKRLSADGVLTEALHILRERGSPLICPVSGGVLACKGGKWADGESVVEALDALDAKVNRDA